MKAGVLCSSFLALDISDANRQSLITENARRGGGRGSAGFSGPTSGSVHDSLDVEEQGSEPHLHQQLVAVIEADANGEVALQHPLLRTLERGNKLYNTVGDARHD